MRDGSVVMLVVEDNPADVYLFKEAVKAAGLSAQLHVVDNGGDAMLLLRGQGLFAGRERPDVVVLDLNIPVKDGREVLREMAADPSLKDIPVAILTTSETEGDVIKLYTADRCRYRTKTPDFGRLSSIAAEVHAWATACSDPV